MLDESYDSADLIPSGFEHLYTEKEGVFKLRTSTEFKTPDDVTRVQAALQKERADHAAVKAELRKFGDRKPEDTLAELDKIEEYKLAAEGKMDEEKIEQLVESRVKSRVAPIERERDTLKTTLTEREEKLQNMEQQDNTRLIRDHMRESAVQAKVDPFSIDDALDFGERVLQVIDDNGTKRVVTKDNAGVTPGVDGAVLLSEMQTKRPRWWPDSNGAGTRDSNGANMGANPFSSDAWNMTAQGQLLKANPTKAEQFAKAAGTTIGGPKPEAKA